MSPPPEISVVVTARGVSARLEETLAAVRRQRLDAAFELVLLDASRTGIDLEELAPDPPRGAPGVGPRGPLRIVRAAEGLSRAGLRNAALELATGPIAVLLDAEATPEGDGFLAALAGPLQAEPLLAGVQGAQEPHASCDALARRLLAERAKDLAALPSPVRIGDGQEGWEAWREGAPVLCRFDLSCAAVRREAWRQEPVPEGAPICDERWAFAVLEAGWWLGHAEGAKARRSYSGPPSALLKALRARPAARARLLRPGPLAALPEPAGKHPERSALLTTAARLAEGGARAAEALRDEGAKAVLDRLRRRVQPGPPLAARPALPAPPDPGAPWWEQHPWPLVREPRHPVPPPPASALSGPLRICWVAPAFSAGAGGHDTLFRLVCALEALGHRCEIVFTSHESLLPPAGVQVRELVRRHFQPIAARCLNWRGGALPDADVHVATTWDTAYVVDRRRRAGAGAYLVQVWEPGFFPAGTQRSLAEEAFKLGLFHVAAGPWLEQALRGLGHRAARFEPGVDPAAYAPDPAAPPPPGGRVSADLRPATPWRGLELAALALAEVQRQRPELEIAVSGCRPGELALPFRATTHGVLPPGGLRALHASSTVGLCLSLSGDSQAAHEMMACGLPVVEADGPEARAAFRDGEELLLAPPTPQGLSAALLRLLGDAELRARLREAGLRRVRELTWARAGLQVQAALRAAVTTSLGVTQP